MKALRQRWVAARQKRWVRWTVDLGLFALIVIVIGLWQTRGHVSGNAPPFELKNLSGQTVSSASLAGKPVLLAFWAPWCGVCKTVSQNYSWVQTLVGDRARVISVASAWNDQGQVTRYVADHGVDYPVLLDDVELSSAFKVEAFPTIYFLDAKGRVKRSSVGYTTTLGLLVRLVLP